MACPSWPTPPSRVESSPTLHPIDDPPRLAGRDRPLPPGTPAWSACGRTNARVRDQARARSTAATSTTPPALQLRLHACSSLAHSLRRCFGRCPLLLLLLAPRFFR